MACVRTPSTGEEVLDAEGNAFERPALALRKSSVGRGCHLARLVGRYGDIGVQGAVGRFDRAEIGVRQLAGTEGLGLQSVAGFGDGEFGQIGHGLATSNGRDAAGVGFANREGLPIEGSVAAVGIVGEGAAELETARS